MLLNVQRRTVVEAQADLEEDLAAAEACPSEEVEAYPEEVEAYPEEAEAYPEEAEAYPS